MKQRTWLTISIVLVQLAWYGYSALAFLGAAFPDFGDDELSNRVKALEVSVVGWRWLAVTLILGVIFYSLRRSTDVR